MAILQRCLALVSLSGVLVSGTVSPDTPLNRVPLLMTHDTAMGYLGEPRRYFNPTDPDDILNAWTKTQIATVTEQLDCGARVFDMRPHVTNQLDDDEDPLVMHHGAVVVFHPFKSMMQEMVDWAAEHPDDLVIAEVVHCGGDTDELKEECDTKSAEVLDELGIPYIFGDDCPEGIQGMTLQGALDKGKLAGGGNVLGLWGQCFQSNYDPTRSCRGYEYETAGVSRKYLCWVNGTNREYAVDNIFEYLDETHATGPPDDGRLWQMQGLWQSGQQSVTLGTTYGASLMMDQYFSRINRMLFENLTVGRWGTQGVDGVNLLEVDDVCDQGNNIMLALDPDFSGNLADYPDAAITFTFGISDSILDGDSIFFPQVPANFSAPVFKDRPPIRNRHRNTRWGATNNIAEFINGSQDKQDEYLTGILGTAILLICIFAVW